RPPVLIPATWPTSGRGALHRHEGAFFAATSKPPKQRVRHGESSRVSANETHPKNGPRRPSNSKRRLLVTTSSQPPTDRCPPVSQSRRLDSPTSSFTTPPNTRPRSMRFESRA